MKKAVLIKSLLPLAATSLLVAADAQADWSGTVSLNSDYTFNGVSQTQNNPALQGSIDYSADNGWYAGTWASNIDYAGDETKLEWDGYTGYYQELTDSLSLDTGIAYYTYHGADYSSDYNYPEVYASFNHGNKLGNTGIAGIISDWVVDTQLLCWPTLLKSHRVTPSALVETAQTAMMNKHGAGTAITTIITGDWLT